MWKTNVAYVKDDGSLSGHVRWLHFSTNILHIYTRHYV